MPNRIPSEPPTKAVTINLFSGMRHWFLRAAYLSYPIMVKPTKLTNNANVINVSGSVNTPSDLH